MRRLVVSRGLALALPAARGARDAPALSPAVGQRMALVTTVVRLGFDQSVKTLPNGIRVYDARGRLVSGAGDNGGPRMVEVTLHACRRARTPSAGPRSRTTATSATACSRSACG